MKKKCFYEQPRLKVVELKVCHQLLAGSTGKSGFVGDPEELDME